MASGPGPLKDQRLHLHLQSADAFLRSCEEVRVPIVRAGPEAAAAVGSSGSGSLLSASFTVYDSAPGTADAGVPWSNTTLRVTFEDSTLVATAPAPGLVVVGASVAARPSLQTALRKVRTPHPELPPRPTVFLDLTWAQVSANPAAQALVGAAYQVLVGYPSDEAATAQAPSPPDLGAVGCALAFRHPEALVVVERPTHATDPWAGGVLDAWPESGMVTACTPMVSGVLDLGRQLARPVPEGTPPVLDAATWDGSGQVPATLLGLGRAVQVPEVPRVCLVMIVRDEEAVLPRSLASAWPFVDAYCVLDTGSRDGTQGVVRDLARRCPKPGVFACSSWKGFGKSRSEALAVARAMHTGFALSLMIDADDSFVGPPGGFLVLPPGSPGGSIQVQFVSGALTTTRTQVFARREPWVYVGVLHEFPFLPPPKTLQEMRPRGPVAPVPPVFQVVARSEGARSQNPRKYLDDVELLKADLARDPTNTRNLFYLAQSYRDSGQAQLSADTYRQVLANDTAWVQERYVACLMLVESTTLSIDDKVAVAWRAAGLNTGRREVAHALMTQCRVAKAWRLEAYVMALYLETFGSKECLPAFLFGRVHVYTWAFYDELCMQALHFGHLPAAIHYVQQCVDQPARRSAVPPAELVRMERNLANIREHMAGNRGATPDHTA